MESEKKQLVFCCQVGHQRSVHCAEKAIEKGLEADWLKEGWLSLFHNVSPEQAKERIRQDHSMDPLIFISDDIYSQIKERLEAIVVDTGVTYEFLLLYDAIQIAHGRKLPSYILQNRDPNT